MMQHTGNRAVFPFDGQIHFFISGQEPPEIRFCFAELPFIQHILDSRDMLQEIMPLLANSEIGIIELPHLHLLFFEACT
ncbi:Uncharacterised protein [Mycobacteroides abscessus subsp. abscessus]|nr:Uncharacterised protein [Mycobacteroides abscessus subsp. abscessus]